MRGARTTCQRVCWRIADEALSPRRRLAGLLADGEASFPALKRAYMQFARELAVLTGARVSVPARFDGAGVGVCHPDKIAAGASVGMRAMTEEMYATMSAAFERVRVCSCAGVWGGVGASWVCSVRCDGGAAVSRGVRGSIYGLFSADEAGARGRRGWRNCVA